MITPLEQHPTGIAAGIATPLSIVIVWVAQALGADMPAEVAAAAGAVIVGAVAALVSWRSPRISIEPMPVDPITDRGITPIDEDPAPIATSGRSTTARSGRLKQGRDNADGDPPASTQGE